MALILESCSLRSGLALDSLVGIIRRESRGERRVADSSATQSIVREQLGERSMGDRSEDRDRKSGLGSPASGPNGLDEPSEPESPFYPSFGINAGFVEELQSRYQIDPDSVDASWEDQFKGRFEHSAPKPPETVLVNSAAPPVESARSELISSEEGSVVEIQMADRYARVLRLIDFYRARGHRIAKSDPLGEASDYFPELDPAHYGLGHADMEHNFISGDLPGEAVQTLQEILDRLQQIYCGSVGFEYSHVQDPGRKAWLRENFEEEQHRFEIGREERGRIYADLTRAELFERFLHTKFIGQKRFSLEGAELAVPMLDAIVEQCPKLGVREVVLGMSHRGRLNVLGNVMGKPYAAIFSEFQDNPLFQTPFGSGDVKYHKGFSADRYAKDGTRVHMTLTSNPSHLEAVDPVALGRAKAKQTVAKDTEGQTILPVLLHGDAAFAGQGIVAETLNLSRLEGYSTGGTIHLIINNQIGFTTTPAEARSTLYCSDVAQMIQVPIFHVNGEDPEAAVHCLKLALEYRQRFGEDVVIDLICYRRHGHNEADEPAFTQPRLYEKIRSRPSVRKLYGQRLVEQGVFSTAEIEKMDQEVQEALSEAYESIAFNPPGPDEPYEPRGPWQGYQRERPEGPCVTGVSEERLAEVVAGLGAVPGYFHVHPKLASLIEQRGRIIRDSQPVDWAMAEALAFGTLVLEGAPVRLSGQDSSRGTFSQRHATFVDQKNGEEYVSLDHLSNTQARFEVYDSLLSEAAVLGFEYGYSLVDPSTLTLWEAQFGDFANGAQVIIDQFITSAPTKWGRMSGLVMLLPHGYEGQGPEHSSARVERFLQSCAEDCLQVVNCTTASQYFHVLRRQICRPYRAPMVIFTPKSLLRSPLAASPIENFISGSFESVIDDAIAGASPDSVERLIFSFGKVHYDLCEERVSLFPKELDRVALIRIEELYPWPKSELQSVIGKYRNVQSVVWAQEEPRNMGGWTFVQERLPEELPTGITLQYAGRKASSSVATGSSRVHRAEQKGLLADAFSGLGEGENDPWDSLQVKP